MTLHGQIVEELRAGGSPKEIAQKLGTSRQTVYTIRYREANGRANPPWFTNKMKLKAAYWWGVGDMSVKDIAQRLKISANKVENFLRDEGFL
jgi:DNA-binding CsgD family transcriptional regulator